ncbi:hypothetical protein TNCT_267711, partial [Trichonephila clavata]
CRKEDLRIVALELGETLSEKVTIVELTEIIKENKYFKEDVEFVKELIQYTIEDRKKAEEAKLREKDLELELARLHRVNSDNERKDESYNSLDASKVKKRGPLTTNEVNDSETWLIKQDQSGINLSDPSDRDPDFWQIVKGSVLEENDFSLKCVPDNLWYVAVTIAETNDRFPSFVKKILKKNPCYSPSSADRILSRYLQYHDFVEMHLDSIFSYGQNSTLPKELFQCLNLKALSLKNNFLEQLPPEIGPVAGQQPS